MPQRSGDWTWFTLFSLELKSMTYWWEGIRGVNRHGGCPYPQIGKVRIILYENIPHQSAYIVL